jgi:hypothetical protein
MKYLLLCIALVMGLSACHNFQSGNPDTTKIERDTANYTAIQWLDSVKNFGTVKFGDEAKVEFTFKNTGDKPLYIIAVQPTCGCTIADYTQTAVMPGNTGIVKAAYDSNHDAPGVVNKNIIVTTNTKNDKHFVLAFTGSIIQ